jgi:Cu+-exporting ATPase
MEQQNNHGHHHHNTTSDHHPAKEHHACCAHQSKVSKDSSVLETGAATVYVCPMHPQIRQNGPGACPICGMALEPEVMTGEEGPSHELIDMTRRFWIGLALTLPVFGLEMGAHLANLHFVTGSTSNLIQMALATPVVLWAGWPFFQRGCASIISRHLNMFTLIAIGTGVAWLYSGNFCSECFS